MTSSDDPTADDRSFVAALARATEEPPANLVGRMQDAAAAPPAAPRMRRRWTVAVVAASLLLVAGAALLVARSGGEGDVGPADAPTLDGNYLPETWPAQLTSPIVTMNSSSTTELSESPTSGVLLLREAGPGGSIAAAWLLVTRDLPGATSARALTDSGDPDLWSGGRNIDNTMVVLMDRRALGVDVLQQTLDKLTMSVEPDATPALSELPDGWAGWISSGDSHSSEEVPVLLAAFAGWAPVGSQSASAYRSAEGSMNLLAQAFVTTVRVGDAAEVVSVTRSLAGPSAASVEIASGVDGVIVDQVASMGRSVVFSPEAGIVVVVSGVGTSDGDLLAIAESARPVSAARWDEFLPPTTKDLPDSVCAALQENPAGLDSVADRNGVTKLGGSWVQILSTDLFSLTTGDRQRVAEAVRNDEKGYEAFADKLGVSERRSFDTMRSVAMEPDRIDEFVADDRVTAAAYAVQTVGRAGCGFG